jgi:hypothetical protein
VSTVRSLGVVGMQQVCEVFEVVEVVAGIDWCCVSISCRVPSLMHSQLSDAFLQRRERFILGKSTIGIYKALQGFLHTF